MKARCYTEYYVSDDLDVDCYMAITFVSFSLPKVATYTSLQQKGVIYGKQNTLGVKKWYGQEKQQQLKELISECGQGLCNTNTLWDELVGPISCM